MSRRRWLALAALAPAACRREGPHPAAPPAPVRIGLTYDLHTLDPHQEGTIASLAVLSNVYEPLVHVLAGAEVRPALAASWEDVEPTITAFHVRPGVLFHDGSPLRAADVAWSLRRVLEDTSLRLHTFVRVLAGVEAVGEHTLRVVTRRACPSLLGRLAQVPIVREGARGLDASAVGTGPYRVVAWDKVRRTLRLRRFDRYRGPAPPVEEAVLHLGLLDDPMAALRDQRFEILQSPARRVQDALRTSGPYAARSEDSLFVRYLGFDVARPASPHVASKRNPFADLRVRQAVASALDRRLLAAGLSVTAVPADQPVPRSVHGFDPDVVLPERYLAGGRRLLATAGYASGFEATLDTREVLAETAYLVRDQLAPLGLDVKVRVQGEDEFAARMARADASLWVNRWACITGDAGELLEELIRPGAGFPLNGGAVEPALEAGFVAAEAVRDPVARRNALRELLGSVTRRAVLVPLTTEQDTWAVHERVDWHPRTDGQVRVADIALTPPTSSSAGTG
jgi:peptide/nickel transport system substrate-binding protein